MNSRPIIFPLFNGGDLAQSIALALGYPLGDLEIHVFPDKEIMPRFETDVKGSEIIMVASLDDPDTKLAELLFVSKTANELGATKIGLVCPYLPYMRQDIAFHAGEGVNSKYFAGFLSDCFDWLITIDPHLHRWHCLDQIYSIPNQVLHAMPLIVDWLAANCQNPILIGPDSESEQWVSAVANKLSAPYLVLEKIRKGDANVEVSRPDVQAYKGHTPVIIDDIISTGQTMIETVKQVCSLGMAAPICIGIHPIFAGDAYQALIDAGAKQVVTCNTIAHPSNQIDVTSLLAEAILRAP